MAPQDAGRDARTRRGPGGMPLALMLLPALAVVVVLFGGGLLLGVLQALGYLPGAGLTRLSGVHFVRVLSDPDFFLSFGMTLYVSVVSTLLAAGFSIIAALVLDRMAARYRPVHFVFQLPLTVPHLVIAVAVMFMLAPAGLLARTAVAVGLIQTPADFPLMVNDRWSIGIIVTYVWKEIPFITLMLLAVLRNAGRDLVDVGRTLKASAWQRFRHITLPTIFPALGAASLIVFAYTFGAFEVPYLLGRTYPMTLPVRAYKHYSDIDLMARPEGIATGLLIALVVAVAVVTAQALTRAARRRGIVL
ncbi:MAG: sugar ABC transporter permease [Desulfobacterales bacterium]|nr:sugar ABC transporter permease [Desulfobacterales bacterium]MDJ0889146.1 sugar ABC transporter permease [Desulfobacterales bacterium]